MNKKYVFLMAILVSLTLVVVFPSSSISQDCDNSNLMSATQQIFYCPMMGSKSTVAAEQLGPFPNTKWKITSIVPKPEKNFNSISFSFQSDGTMVETTENLMARLLPPRKNTGFRGPRCFCLNLERTPM